MKNISEDRNHSFSISADESVENKIGQFKYICDDILKHIEIVDECVEKSSECWKTESADFVREAYNKEKVEIYEAYNKLKKQIDNINSFDTAEDLKKPSDVEIQDLPKSLL